MIKLNMCILFNCKKDVCIYSLYHSQIGPKIVKKILADIGQAGMQELLKLMQKKNMIYVT